MDEVQRKTMDLLKPLIIVGNFLGLFPARTTKTGELKFSVLGVLRTISIFLFSLYNLFYISIWYDFLGSKMKTTTTIAAKVYIVHKISEGIIFTYLFINAILTHKRNTNRMKRILKVISILYDVGVVMIDEKFKTASIKGYIAVNLLWIIVFISDYFILFIWNDIGLSFFSWSAGSFVVIFNSLLIFQLSLASSFFMLGFVAINKELRVIDKRKQAVKRLNNTESKINSLWITAKKRIIVLIYSHDMFVKFVEDWYDQNRLQTLLLIVTNMIAVTSNLYLVICEILAIINGSMINAYLIIYCIYWCILIYAKIFMMISAPVRLMKEASKTALIVHEILTRSNTIEITSELECFSLQLLHHNAKFSVFGLFPLNYSLIGSLTRAIATFLVMLVQFNVGSKN